MKINLFVKQTIKENYKYLLTILLGYIFLAVLYHVTAIENVQIYGIQLFSYIFTLAHALVLPPILFKNYYHQTNMNHLASIPLKRGQIFLSLYGAGLGISVMIMIAFGVLTIFSTSTPTAFIEFTGALLMGFMYYYHLSVFAVVICGDYLFQCVVQLLLIFGPILMHLIYQWALEMYVHTYLISTQLSTILYLIPGVGCASYFLGVEPTVYYALYVKEIVIFVILSLFAIYYRPNEKVGQGMVFHSLSYVVRSVATILGSASLFAIFGSILGEHDYVSQIIVAIIVSMVVAYFVEFVYRKKVKVLYSIKYGVLAAFVVFCSVRIGTKAITDYMPSNYHFIKMSLNDYNVGYGNEIYVRDQKLINDVDSLSRELLEYYHINEKDILNNRLYGHITVRFLSKDGDNFFSRQFNYTDQMKENILNQGKYRDLLFVIFTKNENDLIKQARNKKPITIEMENETYIVDDEHEFYLFENYLNQGLKELYESQIPILDFLQNTNVYMSGEDSEGNYVNYNSMIIYDALSKTFGF